MAGSRLTPGSPPAFTFVLTMGVVNLFGDMTYEGGAAMNGQFMATLGASAAIVSITAGLGEFLGYSLRSVSGYIADRTGRYWLVTFIGYAINLVAVPAMALAGNWQVAALLILAERIGRAIRKPTVEAMLSYTTGKHGKGWVCGVIASLVLGKLYDKAPLPTLLTSVFLSSLFSPLAIFGGFSAVLAGMVFLGIGY